MRRFVRERFGLSLSRSPSAEGFVAAYAELLAEAQQVGAKVFFADEAHFRTDTDLHGK